MDEATAIAILESENEELRRQRSVLEVKLQNEQDFAALCLRKYVALRGRLLDLAADFE